MARSYGFVLLRAAYRATDPATASAYLDYAIAYLEWAAAEEAAGIC